MRWLACFLLLHFPFVRAIPLPGSAAQNANLYINNGEQTEDRSIYIVVSLICMMVLSLLLGSRLSKLKRSILVNRSFMSVLVLALYILVLLFIICSAVLVAGQGLYTHELCRAGTWICLMFYTAPKAVIYVFLVERIHVVRAPFVNRKNDKIYIGCMTMVVVMYGSVTINAYINNVTEMQSDGRCHFGIRGDVSVPFTIVNFVTDCVLTAVFFYLLRPVVHCPKIPYLSAMLGKKSDTDNQRGDGGNETPLRRSIKILLWRSLIGSLLIEIPMAANMIQFVITRGEELGMICFTICLLDVFWDALVIHWLTFNSSGADAERELRSSQASSDLTLSDRAPSRLSARSTHNFRPKHAVGDPGGAQVESLALQCEPLRDSSTDLLRPPPARRG